ncbi:hypothetical protein BDZ97DRAFT_686542 [Flammula alnicola]|nr:hypothetical protein BDZ97DRAFT_686542 [Flammula alnicola]
MLRNTLFDLHWSLDYTRGSANAKWVNPDGTSVPTYIVVAVGSNPSALYVTGDIAAASAALGVELRQVGFDLHYEHLKPVSGLLASSASFSPGFGLFYFTFLCFNSNFHRGYIDQYCTHDLTTGFFFLRRFYFYLSLQRDEMDSLLPSSPSNFIGKFQVIFTSIFIIPKYV